MSDPRLARRLDTFDSSGIRQAFEMASRIKDPVNLSIGQPDFDVPAPVQDALMAAVRSGRNGYSPTQGMPVLLDKLQQHISQTYGQPERRVLITSGTSGALVMAMLALVEPGDEVIVFDPYFVQYPALVGICGGTPVYLSTYPDFALDVDAVRRACTPRTKAILFNSPGNPSGVVADEASVKALAELSAERGIVLISDEIYRDFCFDGSFVSPAMFHRDTLVVDGFSKSHAMTGWRLGYAHGPAPLIEAMTKLQQYTYVCAPQPVQWAGAAALSVPMTGYIDAYRRKRDMIYEGLREHYELARPGGAFYAFPRAPGGSGREFAAQALELGLIVIGGHVFSRQDTHFRISFAAADETLRRGIELLQRLARG